MNIKVILMNGIIASLYVIITGAIAPFGFLGVQIRLSETFNHLIVFHKKYFFGIIIGVLIANLLFSPTKVDLIFGVAHTMLSLLITMAFSTFLKKKHTLMWINTIVFSFNMFIIAYMLKTFIHLKESFFFLWFTLGISEFITMTIGIYLMQALHKRIKLNKLIS